jgi:hypothetical protein
VGCGFKLEVDEVERMFREQRAEAPLLLRNASRLQGDQDPMPFLAYVYVSESVYVAKVFTVLLNRLYGAPCHHGRIAVHSKSQIVRFSILKLRCVSRKVLEDLRFRMNITVQANQGEVITGDLVERGHVAAYNRFIDRILQSPDFVSAVARNRFRSDTLSPKCR